MYDERYLWEAIENIPEIPAGLIPCDFFEKVGEETSKSAPDTDKYLSVATQASAYFDWGKLPDQKRGNYSICSYDISLAESEEKKAMKIFYVDQTSYYDRKYICGQ